MDAKTAIAFGALVLGFINLYYAFRDRRRAAKNREEDHQTAAKNREEDHQRAADDARRAERTRRRDELRGKLEDARKMLSHAREQLGEPGKPPTQAFPEPDHDELAVLNIAFSQLPQVDLRLDEAPPSLTHPPLYRLGRAWDRAWEAFQRLPRPSDEASTQIGDDPARAQEWEAAHRALYTRLQSCIENIDSHLTEIGRMGM